MRFAYHVLGLDIELNPDRAALIIIENPRIKRELVEDLWRQYTNNSGESLFSENGKEISISKQIEMLLNPFSLDFNSKRIKTKLLEEANDIVGEYELYSFLELKTKLFAFMAKVFERMPYPLKVNAEMDQISILKVADIQIDLEEMLMPEKLIYYLKLLQQVCHIKVFIFVDLFTYFRKEELRELLKAGLYSDLCLLFIESRETYRIEECKTFIIDEDACKIEY